MTAVRRACYLCGKPGTPHVWAPPPGNPIQDDHLVCYEGADAAEEVCRAIVIHHGCFQRADFDMWTGRAEWTATRPVVPWDRLPAVLPPLVPGDDSEWDVTQYPTPEELAKEEAR